MLKNKQESVLGNHRRVVITLPWTSLNVLSLLGTCETGTWKKNRKYNTVEVELLSG